MYTDLVFPKNNEIEFIKTAELLNYGSLCFLYTLEDFEKRKSLEYPTNLKIFSAIICAKKQLQKAKKLSPFVIVESEEDDRNTLEQLSPDVMYNFEKASIKNTIKQKYSGINNIYADIMHANNIMILFSLQKIKKNDDIYLGRIMQNIMLAQKHKIDIITATFADSPLAMRNPKDIISLFITLGMNEATAKKSLSNAYSRYMQNQSKKQGKIIADGIEEMN